MDSKHATITGDLVSETGKTEIIAHIKADDSGSDNGEKSSNNREQMLQAKFFKEICTHLVNATHIHVTGTGQIQEQFIHYLASTPQFKNVKTEESTSNKMSDERLLEFLSEKN